MFAKKKLILGLIMIVLVIKQNIKTIFLVVLLITLYLFMINIVKMLYYIEGRMQFINLFKVFLMGILIVEVL